ncbi:unnamed protein product [Phytophthora fragariaefolia]|uniref:Unnamed protein product n=1 Tax=Phytophthora fragariaefolia TaxID=1490495 RepID=A0A9W7CMD4_9STRA|nr:unnamed protein product [Phytophthora fragariaefolia]
MAISRRSVLHVEGIGGFLLDVGVMWMFKLRTVFNKVINVDACIVAGFSDRFLLGVGFMKAHGATMDLDGNEARYKDSERVVVMSFRIYDGTTGTRVAAVRMWIDELDDSNTPQDVYVEAPDAGVIGTKLLRVYRKLGANAGDCPPTTVLDIEDHIESGNASPIMTKRRRQAQVEDPVVDENVTKLLQN